MWFQENRQCHARVVILPLRRTNLIRDIGSWPGLAKRAHGDFLIAVAFLAVSLASRGEIMSSSIEFISTKLSLQG